MVSVCEMAHSGGGDGESDVPLSLSSEALSLSRDGERDSEVP